MLKDSLVADLELVKSFCEQNDIALYRGLPSAEHLGICEWDERPDEGLSVYLYAAKKARIRILHLYVQYNEIIEEEHENIVEAIEKEKSKAEHKQLNEKLAAVDAQKGVPLELRLSFLHEGVEYHYFSRAVLWLAYHTLMRLVHGEYMDSEGDDQENKQKNEANGPDENQLFRYIEARRTAPEKLATLARQIADDPQYIHAKGEKDRRKYARQKAEAAGVQLSWDRLQVIEAAETIFEEEKEVLRDRVRSEKVLALVLKAHPKRIPQREVAIRLNISERELFKYWPKETEVQKLKAMEKKVGWSTKRKVSH